MSDSTKELVAPALAAPTDMKLIPIILAATILSGCMSFGGECHQFTIIPVVSVVNNAQCRPAGLTLIHWNRQ
jgi:hypothetical protein